MHLKVHTISKVISSRMYNLFVNLCQPLKTSFHCDYLAYSRITPTGELFHISNNPEPTIQYWEQFLYLSNPFYSQPHSFKAGCYLLNEIEDANYQTSLKFLAQSQAHAHMRVIIRQKGFTHQFIIGSKNKSLP